MAEGGTHNFGQTPLPCGICDSTDNVIWNCADCKVNLCIKCYNDHLEGKPVRLFKNHKIVRAEEALRSKYFEEFCAMHPGSVCILNCNTCHQLVCVSCVTGPHKGHEHCKIEDAITKAYQDITRFQEMVEHSLLPQCNDLGRTIKENIKQCEDWYTSHSKHIQMKREQLITDVHCHCDELLRKLTTESMNRLQSVEEDDLLVEAKVTELKTMLDTKAKIMEKNHSEIIQFTKHIKDTLLPAVSLIQLSDCMRQKIDSLRVVQTYGKSDEQHIHHSDAENNGNKNQIPPRDRTKEESQKKSSHEKTEKRETHHGQSLQQAPIIDIRILSRHKLKYSIQYIDIDYTDTAWVSSFLGKELRQVNMNGEILKQINTNLDIAAFKVIGSDEILIATHGGKCLQKLSRTGEIITDISTDPYYPSGVCLTKDGQHVVVCLYREDMTSTLQVYTTDGQLVQTVDYTDRKSSGFYIQQVTTNASGDYCVAHIGLHTVFVISNTGSLRYTYDGSTARHYKGIFYPCGIVSDRYNHLLVSDSYNNAIHMLDQEGQFLRYLLSYSQNGIIQPCGLSLDSEGKLWVGQKDGMLLVVMYFK